MHFSSRGAIARREKDGRSGDRGADESAQTAVAVAIGREAPEFVSLLLAEPGRGEFSVEGELVRAGSPNGPTPRGMGHHDEHGAFAEAFTVEFDRERRAISTRGRCHMSEAGA